MPIWDIIGPVMIGPSSSHTAGAVRIGRMVRMCCGGDVVKADIYMRGSFAKTGSGHGTDKALLAGLMGFKPDDPRVRDGLKLAKERGLDYRFFEEDVDGARPNSARILATNKEGRVTEAIGVSIGGGAVELEELDGFQIGISGALPAVIILNRDVQGVVGAVTTYLSKHGINIATMKLHRDSRGGLATMVLELDSDAVDKQTAEELKQVHPAIVRAIAIKGDAE